MSAFLSVTVSIGFLVAIIYAAIKLAQNILSFRRYAAAVNKFPQDEKNPIWGHLGRFPGPNEEGLKFQRQMTTNFPYCSLAWLGPFLSMLVVNHPDTVKTILKTSEPKAAQIYNLIRPWVGDGLLLSKGSKWARNRRMLTPAFHFDILRPYITIKNRAVDILLSKMDRFSQQDNYFEVFTEVSLFTLDVILKCAFSYDTDCQNIGTKHPYVNAVNTLSHLATDRFFKPWLHNKWVYMLTPSGRQFQKCCDLVHSVAEDIIENRRRALLSHSVEQDVVKRRRCMDFLDILLTARDDDGEGLTPQEIRDETDTFLFEGHDTTASALSWTLYSLAEHQECQEAVYREVEDLMSRKQNTDIEMEDLPHLPYLTMCLKESLRLHTPVPFIQREITQPILVDGQEVPKGTIVSVVLYNLHHNPVIWPNSLEFQPERFAPENAESRDHYSFVPFSAGPRNCIGQNFAMHELKIALARVIHRFRLELDKNQTVRKVEDIVMRAENGIRMKAIPRVKVT
ncbi:cytochrome P450 4F4-like [Haliotis asinina]|uniref:cytochrome P450 4F4-like n=1 Tax=Haliotis asinina TaxID=109174 RepID=UPI003531CC18